MVWFGVAAPYLEPSAMDANYNCLVQHNKFKKVWKQHAQKNIWA
jgi:hypothetical protein